MHTNPTIRAVQALRRRGWHARSALAFVCHLFHTGDLAGIRALAACERGMVAVEFAMVISAIGLTAIIGAQQVAPPAHEYVLRAEASVLEARQALTDACHLLRGQGADTSMCPTWALPEENA